MIKTLRTRGFTLIEMAISLIIIGVLIGAVAYPYSVWLKKHRHETTVSNVDRMAFAIGAFRSANGRYPCPAAFDLPRTDANYGQPTDCTNTALTTNSCTGGVCIANSRRLLVNIDVNNNNTIDTWEANFRPRVRIGTVPFRALNIAEEFTVDSYGNKILYAVTESLAADYPYNPEAGGISLEYDDENGIRTSRVPVPHSGHFVVLSHGANRVGGFTKYGVSAGLTCNTATPDGENCDHITGTPNPTFYVGDFSTSTTNMHDDVALHSMPLNAPLWARSPDNPDSIYAILSSSAGGKVGGDYLYNALTANDPNALGADTRLFIRGNMLVDDGSGTGGDTLATEFCSPNGDDCFPADMIGGDGVSCPDGKMFGVNNADAACQNNTIDIDCPSDKILKSLTNGVLICDYRPCRSENITTCSQSVSLPNALHGETEQIYAGDSECYSSIYACDNGDWKELSALGQCSCTAGTTSTVSACAAPFVGDGVTISVTQICDLRDCRETSETTVDCNCPPGTSGTPPNCTCDNGGFGIPDCLSCGYGQTGTPPDCEPILCPAGTTGTYGNCTCINGGANPPDCDACPTGYSGTPATGCTPPPCPGNTTGTYPNCACANGGEPPSCTSCPPSYTGTPPNCVPPQCPAGYNGVYPNCVCANGNPNIADCNACSAGSSGTWPNCESCPAGTSGTPPNCACNNGATNPPSCTLPTCPAGTSGTPPNCTCNNGANDPPTCSAPTCAPGTSGTPPNCTCNNGYTNPPTCTCQESAIQCCNGFNNPPVCGPPVCDPLTECCNAGDPGCGNTGLPPCQGGAQPPTCYIP